MLDNKNKNGRGLSLTEREDILPVGALVHGRWKLIGRIGAGGFGQVFVAEDSHDAAKRHVAVKLEPYDKTRNVLKMEVAVLKALSDQPQFVKLLDCGRTPAYNFMTMTLGGRNLADLRRNSNGARLDLRSISYVTAECIKALRDLHDHGVIHRDIKPANIVVGANADDYNRVMIIDFGLARVFLKSDGSHREARESASFRGTSRYASWNAHNGFDLSRRDDMISLLYSVAEMARGSLPWRHLSGSDKISESKQQHSYVDLVKGMPAAFEHFARHIGNLSYEDRPTYDRLIRLFEMEASDSKGRYPPRRLGWSQAEAAFEQRGCPVRGDRIKVSKPFKSISAQTPNDAAAAEPMLRLAEAQQQQAQKEAVQHEQIPRVRRHLVDSAQPAEAAGDMEEDQNEQALADIVMQRSPQLQEQDLPDNDQEANVAYETPKKQFRPGDADDSNIDQHRLSFASKVEGALSPDIHSEPGGPCTLPRPPLNPPRARRHTSHLRRHQVARKSISKASPVRT
eukprot:TRINITY_DN11160_c0_g1_i1.p1 TRINITY_DN11160_c0_g1~~TRINITY_DN11160_c0_g1_i1.p1  ORF type:complete len:511 (+),score=63.23 TRINITY_DN11160_c0_g1_i1:152-1684(+)